jgi:DNA-binding transcriptional LysR family regulator
VLTIHQLQVFTTVAELGSVRRAAEQLVVSQPAVSASLASLEREVGVDLFAKVGRGIELTDAGRTFERYARVMLGLVDEAIAATRFAHQAIDAPVRIGATTASADHMLMPQLARVRERRPELTFTLEVANRARIWQLLTDRVIDVAISTRPPGTGGFASVATRPNEFVLVSKPGLVWSGKVADATWLIREDGSSTRAATDEVLTLLGIMPTTLPIGSNAAIQRSAEAGLGVALLPNEAVREAVANRVLTVVRTDATPLRKPWHVVVRDGEPLAPSAQRFVEDLVADGREFAWTPGGAALVRGAER